jgi:hypothetical protein
VAVGYVERLPDPSHNGGFLVHLTKKGLHVVDGAIEHLANHSALAPAMSQLSPDERKRGAAFALKILSSLERAEVQPEEEPEEPAKRGRNGRKR